MWYGDGVLESVILCMSFGVRRCVWWCVFFFFFQAEDGIRDIGVTGVQTCALPICFVALELTF